MDLDVPHDQRDLLRLTPATAGGVPVWVMFSGPAADVWRAGGRRVLVWSTSWPSDWRPWQRDATVLRVERVEVYSAAPVRA